MKVEICTSCEDPTPPKRPSVVVKEDVRIYSVAAIDTRIKQLQIAKLWLKKATR